MSNKITTDLLEFIENSPSCFHAVQTTKEILTNMDLQSCQKIRHGI